MVKKKLLVPILLITILALLFGCSGGGKQPVTAQGSEKPASAISGYYSHGQSISGGKDLHFINLRDIKIEKADADTVITLEFREGSLQMGMEESPTSGVPKYSTQWLDGVDRLVLNITGLTFWDFKVYDDEIKDTPILGIFKQVPVDGELTKLYINLKDDVAYKITEEDNLLKIHLRAMPEEEHSDYYVMLNAFDEYTLGKIPADSGLAPTLCVDKTNVTLLSAPFGSAQEANKFIDEKVKPLVASLGKKTASVVELKNNQLPTYDTQGAMGDYADTPVIRTDGKEGTAPVLVSNGRVLCWRPDGKAYVFVTPFFLGGGDGEEATTYEKIYMWEEGKDAPTLLSDFEYNSIEKAAFSDDGRYLALLEQSDTNRSLYIYDCESDSGQMATAAEAGFGIDTADFAWGSDNRSIYAITGEADMLQLMVYRIHDDGDPEVATLKEDAFSEGSIGCFDGKVYYSQSGTQPSDNNVYMFDPATSKITRLCSGLDFELNRKTGLIAIVDDDSTPEKEAYNLKIYDAKTGKTKIVESGKLIGEREVWTNDGSELYYTIYYENANENDRFKQALYRYDVASGKSTKLTDIVQGDIGASNVSKELLLTYIFNTAEQFVPITYKIPFGK